MSGLTDKLGGQAKQVLGNATDDKKLQAEGKAEETKGTLKEKLEAVVDTVSDKVNEAKDKLKK